MRPRNLCHLHFHSPQISPTSLNLSNMKFYKIIRTSNVEKSYLKLPENFEKRFGRKLPRYVTLDVPSGAKWRVGVERRDVGVCLMGQGWAEFVDGLGLRHGDFLMFEYDAMSDVFHVVVMGMSASEIKYPALVTDEDPVVVIDDEYDDDDVVLVTGGEECNTKKTPTPCRYTKELTKGSKLSSKGFENSCGDPSGVKTHPQAVKKRGRYLRCDRETIFNNEGRIQCVVQGKLVYHTSDEAEQALARAKAFKPVEPVFIIALQPSYLSRTTELTINRKCYLIVPQSFILEYFDLAVKYVILETHDKKTWHVMYHLSDYNVRFLSGWRKFADDKCLATGDVCVFELVRGAGNALKVAIFRTTGEDEVPVQT